MRKVIIVLFFLEIITALSAYQIISINNADESLREMLKKNNIEIIMSSANGTFLEAIVGDSLLNYLDSAAYTYQVLQTEEEIRRYLTAYHSYDQVVDKLENIAADHPEFADLFSLGPSTCKIYFEQGYSSYADYQHEVWCIKLSDNPNIEEDEPNVYFGGLIHAREAISLEVTLFILDYLADNYGIDPDVTNWINNTQIWFFPLINPDGYKIVYDQINTMHRKNLRDNNNNHSPGSSTDGVDLNRNFGYVWGSNGTSSTPSNDLYHGPYAWSEIETTYLRDIIQARRFAGGITYHSHAEQVLYPLGHLPGACSYDHLIMHDLATEMAVTIPKITGTGHYQAEQAVDFGYTCQGTMGDWGYAEERLFSFTIELATQFIPPQSQIAEICQDNLQAALIFLDRVHHSTLTGHVTNAQGNTLEAEILIEGIDDATGMSQVEPYSSSQLFGRFDRMLLPGNYTVTFSKDGYISQTIENVMISENNNTSLEVVLQANFPQNLTISVSENSVALNWLHVPGAVQYNIYRATSPDNFPETPYAVTQDNNFSDDDISGNIYFYRVTSE